MSSVNFLEKLLDGVAVEWKQLGELEDEGFVKLGRGNVISKKDLASTPGDFPVYSSSAIGIGEFGRYGKYMFDDERITWSVDGGGRFFFRSAHKYSVTNVCGWMTVLKQDRLNTRFLYHVLSGSWERKVFDYIKKAHPSVIRDEYEIPIPCPDNPKKSLEIQAEIVRILDAMTAHTAELTARKKQYRHYLDKAFDFSTAKEINNSTTIFAWRKLEDLCTIGDGLHGTPEYDNDGEYFFINGNNLSNGYLKFNKNTKKVNFSIYKKYGIDFNPENTLFLSINGTIGNISFFKNEKIVLGKSVAYFNKTSDDLNLRYLFYFFKTSYSSRYFEIEKTGSTIKNLGLRSLRAMKIPLPSLEVQNRVVSMLDKFDALTASITEGLPREIELREKQYAYYRDLLLSFPHAQKA